MVIASCQNEHESVGVFRSDANLSANLPLLPSLERPRGLATPIWMVARATTAFPRYFKPISIGDGTYVDGSVMSIDPSEFALRESGKPPALFVSLGIRGMPKFRERSDAAFDDHRLHAEGRLRAIAPHDWHPPSTGKTTLEKIRHTTAKYLSEAGVQGEIDSIAHDAVRIRRARAETERWEAFAVDVVYTCPLCCCRHRLRSELRRHLETGVEHRRLAPEEVDAALDEGRTYEDGTPSKMKKGSIVLG